MADDDNVVLRLLREIRGDTSDLKSRLTRVERRLGEINETMVTAMGMAAHSYTVVEKNGERFDEIVDEIAALKKRVNDLEARS